MTTILLLGFLLGMRHAMEPDHLAAVATLATRSRSLIQSSKLGAAWGMGHTITLFCFGAVVMLFKGAISERMANSLELAVGVMLVILGIDVLRRMVRERIHFHVHDHADGTRHFHAHSHADAPREQGAADGKSHHAGLLHAHVHGKGFPFRALFVGMMHGMAGSAALIVLTLQTVPNVEMGAGYILIFGLGSMLGMAVLSIVISLPMHHSARHFTRLFNVLQTSVGAGTLLLGSYVIFDLAPSVMG